MILASSSPRRAEILRALGIRFRVVPSRVDETLRRGESPRRYVRRLALEKARAVAERHPKEWVVGSDTTVVVEGKVLGKPRDAAEAKRMLRKLSGRGHYVFSGVALVHRAERSSRASVASTRVFFRPLEKRDIEAYVRSREPFGKAGAYAIQGKGALLVERIEGSYTNVVGFPVEKFVDLWQIFNGPGLPGSSSSSSSTPGRRR